MAEPVLCDRLSLLIGNPERKLCDPEKRILYALKHIHLKKVCKTKVLFQ
jgi:hypothetical protein